MGRFFSKLEFVTETCLWWKMILGWHLNFTHANDEKGQISGLISSSAAQPARAWNEGPSEGLQFVFTEKAPTRAFSPLATLSSGNLRLKLYPPVILGADPADLSTPHLQGSKLQGACFASAHLRWHLLLWCFLFTSQTSSFLHPSNIHLASQILSHPHWWIGLFPLLCFNIFAFSDKSLIAWGFFI